MKNTIIIILTFLSISLIAQDTEYEDLDFKSLNDRKTISNNRSDFFKLSFLFPEIGGEVGLSKQFSLDFGVKLNPNLFIFVGSGRRPTVSFNPQPVLHAEPKWNYNILRRAERSKKTDKFSSNFLSLYTDFNVKVSPNTLNKLVVAPTWGMQRAIGEIGYFKLNLGMGYQYTFSALRTPAIEFPIAIILDFKLGLMF